jgi:hypothetical protein
MKIHLIRSEEVNTEWYHELLRYLQSFPGPMEFMSSDEVPTFEFDEDLKEDWSNTKKEVELPDVPIAHYSEVDFSLAEPMLSAESRPNQIMRLEWKKIFSILDLFRQRKDVGDAEFTSLISDLGNEHNWFSVPDLRGKRNYYVQSSGWGHYVDSDSRFPVAYSVVTNVLRHLMIDNVQDLKTLVHMQPRGCMNDFNENKKDVVLKLRTADLCSTCVERIKNRQIDSMLVTQVLDILESIRSNVLFRERFEITKRPSRLLIAGPKKRIFFSDLPNCELRLTPLEKTVFLFFLRHELGFTFTELDAHEQELLAIYTELNPNMEHDKAEKSIRDMVNPLFENSLNEKISKIKKKIINAVGNELSEYYVISGNRNEKKRIGLDRSLVSFG